MGADAGDLILSFGWLGVFGSGSGWENSVFIPFIFIFYVIIPIVKTISGIYCL